MLFPETMTSFRQIVYHNSAVLTEDARQTESVPGYFGESNLSSIFNIDSNEKNQHAIPTSGTKYPPPIPRHQSSYLSSSISHSSSPRSINNSFSNLIPKDPVETSPLPPSSGGHLGSYTNRLSSTDVTSPIDSISHTEIPWGEPSDTSYLYSGVGTNDNLRNFQQNYNNSIDQSRSCIMPGLSAIGSIFGNGVRSHMADAMTGGMRPIPRESHYPYLTSLSHRYANEDGRHPHIFDLFHSMNCVASEMTNTMDTDNLMYENIDRCHEESQHHETRLHHQPVDVESSHFSNNVKFRNSNIRSHVFLGDKSVQSYRSPNFPIHRKHQILTN